MDLAACLEEVVAGLVQPDGRAPGTPGGDAATTFLITALDTRGLGAPTFGRTQSFAMSARRTTGRGVLTWGGRTRVAGDDWSPVPGSPAGTRIGLILPGAPSLHNVPLAGAAGPAWWILANPEFDPVDAIALRIEPPLATELAGRPFDVVLPPARVTGHNVVAWVPGQGALADEVVLVVAHRDHLPELGELVFPGADDNASGVAATVCALAAHAAASERASRRAVLGIWFDGEEDGMWGSAAWVADPGVPLSQTKAVLALDMVGRLAGSPLVVAGSGAEGWIEAVATSAAPHGLALRPDPTPSHTDDLTFAVLGIPAAHLFTGHHPDYHRPSDEAVRLDWQGLTAITAWTVDLLDWLATTGALPRPGPGSDSGIRLGGVDPAGRPVLGAVLPGSPADQLGWHPGDAVVFRDNPTRRVEPCFWLGGLGPFTPDPPHP